VGSYKERQVAHLCPKHAFNHVLQEEKIVWRSNKPLLLVEDGVAAPAGASPKESGVKINMWAFCKDRGLAYLREQRTEYLREDAQRLFRQLADGEPKLNSEYYKNPKYTSDFPRDLAFWKSNLVKYGGKSVEEIVAILDKEYGRDESLEQLEEGGIGCTMNGASMGDLPFAWFTDMFDLLGYRYIEVVNSNYRPILNEHITDPKFLGLVVNQGGWHYVAVPRYVKGSDCQPSKYVLADSLDGDVYECLTKRELMAALDSLPLVRAYLIFARDEDAYQSVAVKRMVKKMGRKKKTMRL